MKNWKKVGFAALIGLVVITLIALVAGPYAVPFAIMGAGAALMLFGNHIGIYALPAPTIALMKKTIKVALIAVVVILVTTIAIKEGGLEEDSGRQYAAHYNWSKDQRDFFVKKVKIPERSKGWVSIALPPNYRIKTSRTFDIEYDFGGKETVKEGPNLPWAEVGDITPTFDVRAVGEGGELTIWLHRNPLSKSVK